jgi:hypothetical protein
LVTNEHSVQRIFLSTEFSFAAQIANLLLQHVGAGFSRHVRAEARTHMSEGGVE